MGRNRSRRGTKSRKAGRRKAGGAPDTSTQEPPVQEVQEAGVPGGPDPADAAGSENDDPPSRYSRRKRLLGGAVALAILVAAGAAGLVFHELHTSRLQARYFHPIASQATFHLEEGPWADVRFPTDGPWNVRLGYTGIPDFTERLGERGFHVSAQARTSDRFQELMSRGLNPPYDEKSSAGLRLLDRRGEVVHHVPVPGRVYAAFDSIPELLWRSLLYIESRDFLDPRRPTRNPAVQWERLARGVWEFGLRTVGGDRSVPGGSTLATQIEKFRHSPGGLTRSPGEKVRQMASASLRAYRHGEETLEAQRRIILDYMNSVPLSASPGFGEVTGIGDGLWAWFGTPFEEANRLLREEGRPEEESPLAPSPASSGDPGSPAPHPLEGDTTSVGAVPSLDPPLVYRQALSLMIAQRRPSWYLLRPEGQEELVELTDRYLRLLERDGVIDGETAGEALALRPVIWSRAPAPSVPRWAEQKGVNDVRTNLMRQIGFERLYDLGRLDASAWTTLDEAWHREVLQLLEGLRDPAFLRQHGFDGPRLLDRGDPQRVLYTVVLYERTPSGNLLRVLADNLDAPLSLNASGRLELGSTAKLRTLVTYLETIEALHHAFSPLSPDSLRAVSRASARDPLARWVTGHLLRAPEATLHETLEAAMRRTYPADPGERFATGGGVQTFSNFDNTFNDRSLTVLEGFRHSVNLVFVRMMRDIVHHHMYGVQNETAQALEDASDPARQRYLARFAHEEGGRFVARFERKYRGRTEDELLDLLVEERRLSPQRMAWAYRAVAPDSLIDPFERFLQTHLPDAALSEGAVADLYARSDPSRHPLADLGVLASIHPLELWVAGYLLEHPDASAAEVLEASIPIRQDVYGWLFRTTRRNAQDVRIRTILEMEAFQEIHRQWQLHGYPFPGLVPSFGTSIGSSGDRPAALAELVGIILADGMRYPTVRVQEIRFAEDTPWETRLERGPAVGVPVLSVEVAQVTRAALVDVVERGTARRALGAFHESDGSPMVLGGKTGTGDNRFRVFARGGQEVESRVVNRTSTLVFFAGDRWFGTVTAYVPGPEAAGYRFTSGLPAQMLRVLGPRLTPPS
jgi:membrane peptidoglycan carboxypeptidase